MSDDKQNVFKEFAVLVGNFFSDKLFKKRNQEENFEELRNHSMFKMLDSYITEQNVDKVSCLLSKPQQETVLAFVRARCELWRDYFNKRIDEKMTYKGVPLDGNFIILKTLSEHTAALLEDLKTKYDFEETLVDNYINKIYSGTLGLVRTVTITALVKNTFSSRKKLWLHLMNAYTVTIANTNEIAYTLAHRLFEGIEGSTGKRQK